MPDSFFATTKSRKRKRAESAPRPSNGRTNSKSSTGVSKLNKGNAKKGKQKALDEELSDQTSEDEDDLDLQRDHDGNDSSSGEEDDNETPAEKRLRLAKLYLDSLKGDLAESDYDAAVIDREIINARLKQDVLEHSGKLHLFVADAYDFSHQSHPTLRTRGHRFSVTAAVATETCQYLFTSGKEGSIIRWDLSTGKILNTFYKARPSLDKLKNKGKKFTAGHPNDVTGHTDEILALAASSDGKYLASAGRDKRIGVWDAEKGEWIRSFGGHLGHKDAISALAFRKNTHQLYTGSFDRTLKLYDLSPNVMGYVETLFGHQDHVMSVDALRAETCVSVGAHDKTARFWKIVDETQLVFRGGGRSRIREVLEGGLYGDEEGEGVNEMESKSREKPQKELMQKFVEGRLECIAMIDENTFVSGGDSGSICLWTTQKKKPIFTQPLAHGVDELQSSTTGLIQKPRWITALGCLCYSDLFASGSWEGTIRLWKLDPKLKFFTLTGTIPGAGVVNSLQLLTVPKEFPSTTQWTKNELVNGVASKQKKEAPLCTLIVAGLGQEHRLGRWIKVGKEKGGANGGMVVLLQPRSAE